MPFVAGTVLCLTSNSNDYTEFGTLWTQAETDDTTETATDGSSTQTNLYDDDTQQVSPDEIRVMANEKSSAGSHTETSKLRLDDLGYRKEFTHSADTFVIETPAPATTAGAKQAEPTVTQSSQSSWGFWMRCRTRR